MSGARVIDGQAYVSGEQLVKSSRAHSGLSNARRLDLRFGTYMIVYRSEHLLWSYDQARHLPYCHLKVHLRKFE